MAPTERLPATLTAPEIVALGDAELDEFLERNRQLNGDIVVDLSAGLSDVPEDKRERFFQRLRDRVHAENAAPSRPVDLDKVTKRLLDIPAEDTSRSDRPAAPLDRMCEDIERESYVELIKDGGRPCYPVSLIDDIARNVMKHKHTNFTRPWQHIDRGPATAQRTSWLLFRRWQQYSRKDCTEWGQSEPYKACESAHTGFVSHFGLDNAGLPEYAEAVKALLAEDNFERPFQLKEDPTEQDELSTWIEYLGYEYWRYRWHCRTIEELQPDYETASEAIKVHQPREDLKRYRNSLALYRDTEIDRDRHKAQYTWVRNQVPLIEAGLESGQEPMYKTRTPTPPAETLEDIERECYSELAADGGRPCYPFHLIEEVFKVPEKYPEFAAPWGDWYCGPVTHQHDSWKSFRMWQTFNRKDVSEWAITRFHYCKWGYLAFRKEFQLQDAELPVYAQAVATLLAKDDFHQPFRLDEDPTKQDKLSTWIEYLGYEYWQHHWATDCFQKKQQRHDEAMKVFDSGNYEGEDMEKHKDAVMDYKDAKKRSALHGGVARWIREQIPLVEAEMEADKAVAATPRSACNGKRKLNASEDGAAESQTSKKRTRSSKRTSPPDKPATSTPTATRAKRLRNDDSVNRQPSSKRMRMNGRDTDPPHASSSKADAPVSEKPRSLRGRTQENSTAQVAKTKERAGVKAKGWRIKREPKSAGDPVKLRRSARVAARQNQ